MNSSRSLSETLFFVPKLTNRQFVSHLFRRLRLPLMLALMVCLTGGYWLFHKQAFSTEVTAKQQSQEQGIPVEVVELKPVDSFARKRTYTGKVEAARTSELSLERSGKLIEINVDEGDPVKADMILARLDTRHLKIVRQKLQAERDSAQARLDELLAGPRPQTIAAAEAAVRQLIARLKNLQSDHERNEQLLERNAISKSVYEASQYDVQQQQAQLDAAKSQLSELKEGTRKEQLAAQKAVVANLDAQLADNQIDLEDTVLKAPFSGRISKRYADEGTVISPETPLLRLVEDQQLEAHIGVPVEMTPSLKRGARQQVQLNGKTYQSTLKAVLPELDPVTRTREVVLALDKQAAEQLIPGQVIRLAMEEPVEMRGFWLPLSALARGERGLWSAYAVVPGKVEGELILEKRQIEVLHTEGDRVLVRGTLKSGDRMVVDGIHKLANNQRVVIKSDS